MKPANGATGAEPQRALPAPGPDAPPGAPSAHQLWQRGNILAHAAKLFAQNGYAKTTVDMISAVALFNKSSLYYYFNSKRDILFELINDATCAACDMARPAARMPVASEAIRYLVRVGIGHLYAHQDAVRIFAQENPYLSQILSEDQAARILENRRNYMKIVYGVISQGIATGEFEDVDVKMAGLLFISWMTASINLVDRMDWEDLAQNIARMFLAGMAQARTEQRL